MPEGIVDVIPVDLVVAAIIAAAAAARRPTSPTIVQVASGSVNPLRYRHLVDLVRTCFTEHPLYDAEGQPIVVPEWSFPGRGRVQRQLERAKSAHRARPRRRSQPLPLRGKQAELGGHARGEARGGRAGPRLRRALRRLRRVRGDLRRRPPPRPVGAARRRATRRTFCFDPRVIDWDHYVHDVHLPSVVEHARVRTTPGGRTGENREDRLRRQVLAPDRHLAAFDLENTLIASNVVASYSWLATRRLPARRPRSASCCRRCARRRRCSRSTARDRSDFLRHFYRRYDGRRRRPARGRRRRAVQRPHPHQVVPGRHPPGARAPRASATARCSSPAPSTSSSSPLRPLFDDIVCAVARPRGPTAPTAASSPTCRPPARPGPRRWSTTPTPHGFDLAESVAYADSTSDLPCSRPSASRWR